MQNGNTAKNKFFLSVWIIFLISLPAYSLYVYIVSPELALNQHPQTDQIVPYVSFRIIIGVYFTIAILSVKKIFNSNFWIGAIILIGIISRLILIPSQPILEDDYHRYLWDGAVTANGINPYMFSPEKAMSDTTNVPERIKLLAGESGIVITSINHPHVRTIYPVLAQSIFAVSYFIAPWQVWMWKVILLFFDLLVLIFLILILRQIKLPLFLLSIYWLNPIVIHEFFNAAHMDLLAILFVTISIYLYLRKKPWMAIVFLAFATGTKLYPLVLLPLYLLPFWNNKRTLGLYTLGYLIIVFILFIPVLASNLDLSLGYVRYAERWVNNSAVYTLFRDAIFYLSGLIGIQIKILPRIAVPVVYFICLFFILRMKQGNHFKFLEKALLAVAVLYIISPTQFPWYFTWLVPLLVFKPKVSLLLYAVLLPLYQLNYLSKALVYIQHIPVLVVFIWELRSRKIDFRF